MAQLNSNNFLIWHSSSAGNKPLPRTFELDTGICSPVVMIVPGESYSFLSNAPNVNIASMSLSKDGVNFTPLSVSSDSQTVGDGKTYCKVNFSLSSGAPGTYKIYANGGAYVSNSVEVISDTAIIDKFSALVEFWHKKKIENFYYPYWEGGMQKLRIRLTLREQQPDTEIKSYESVSNGFVRNLQGRTREYYIFETPEYSREMHQAAKLFTLHDIIKINGRQFIRRPENTYTIIPEAGSAVSTGEFGLFDNESTILFA